MSNEPTAADQASAKNTIAVALEEGLKSKAIELPVMPRVANKVFNLTNDPSADMSDLSALIHSDQSIASHVLRIANSAAYGGGDQIVSLKQAVTRLGMNLLGDIAFAVSIQSDIFKAPGFEAQIGSLLKHALASAAYGREIARKRRRNVEGQFLCGLLHSVGKPIALQLIANLQIEKGIQLEISDVGSLVGRFNRPIAIGIAKEWKLPKQLQITTVFYKNYPDAPTFKDESAATYLSQMLASWLLNPAKYNALILAEDPVFEYLNFYPDDIKDLLAKKDDVQAVVSAMEL